MCIILCLEQVAEAYDDRWLMTDETYKTYE